MSGMKTRGKTGQRAYRSGKYSPSAEANVTSDVRVLECSVRHEDKRRKRTGQGTSIDTPAEPAFYLETALLLKARSRPMQADCPSLQTEHSGRPGQLQNKEKE